jgi:hypothetical protein
MTCDIALWNEERKPRIYVETESAWQHAFNPGASSASVASEQRIDFRSSTSCNSRRQWGA